MFHPKLPDSTVNEETLPSQETQGLDASFRFVDNRQTWFLFETTYMSGRDDAADPEHKKISRH